ncbi:MAG TPA: hypothetical protein VHD56_10995 [Tepidisphaeraceae bacterium]|nr:hypothetical protein [Tepidisphaeraceae bacterium]
MRKLRRSNSATEMLGSRDYSTTASRGDKSSHNIITSSKPGVDDSRRWPLILRDRDHTRTGRAAHPPVRPISRQIGCRCTSAGRRK